MHDSAHWEGLFELINIDKQLMEGKQSQEIPAAVHHALVA